VTGVQTCALPICLAPETTAQLRRLGLTRLGQLIDLPRAALERRFPRRDAAAAARLRLDRLLGLCDEPLTPLVPPPVFLSRRHFAAALLSLETVEHTLPHLLADLLQQLEAQHMGARRLALALWRVDGSAARVYAGTHAPCRDARHLLTLLREKLARIEPGYGIDVISLAAERVEPLAIAQSTLAAGPADTTPAPLDHLVDRLANRLGGDRIAWLHPRASHLPERAQRLAPVPPSPDAWPPAATPRPFLLLEPPEEVTAMAALPDEPPRLFTWRRVTRRVVAADGPERITPEWWRELGATTSRSRDYYRVETETDGCFWLFRDGGYGDAGATGPPRWYLHGFFG
jgi:protein ImuB